MVVHGSWAVEACLAIASCFAGTEYYWNNAQGVFGVLVLATCHMHHEVA